MHELAVELQRRQNKIPEKITKISICVGIVSLIIAIVFMNINRDIGMVGFFGVLITICFLVGRFNFSFNGIIGGVQRTLEIMEKTGSNCMIPANRVTPESIDYLLKNYPITSGVPFKNLQSRINKVEERNK